MVEVTMNEKEYQLWEKFKEEQVDEIAEIADDAVDIKENPDGSFEAVTV